MLSPASQSVPNDVAEMRIPSSIWRGAVCAILVSHRPASERSQCSLPGVSARPLRRAVTATVTWTTSPSLIPVWIPVCPIYPRHVPRLCICPLEVCTVASSADTSQPDHMAVAQAIARRKSCRYSSRLLRLSHCLVWFASAIHVPWRAVTGSSG
jgi:hypothetical protein